MASVTIKSIPDDLLDRLRREATAAHRSVNQQILCLLEQALTTVNPKDNGDLHTQIEAQVCAWEALAGRWETEESSEEEIERIYAARTTGHKVEL